MGLGLGGHTLCRMPIRVRSMLRTPAITIVALVSLALGIGANTAIFSFMDAVMLRSLPVQNPQQLVKLGTDDWDGITDSFACHTTLLLSVLSAASAARTASSPDTAAMFSMINDPTASGRSSAVGDDPRPDRLRNLLPVLGVGAQIGPRTQRG